MISVIIPLYNAEETITTALDSIKKQTWNGEFEIIIVNDGSTDNSRQVVENFTKVNSGINTQLINQENGGVSNARNTGLRAATGDYIALLDADDEWFPQKIERQISILESKNLEVDFLGCRRKNQELLFPYKVDENNLAVITFRKLMFRNETQPSTVIFKRKVLTNSGYFNENQRYAEDLNYWLKISEHNKMYIVNEELVLTGAGKRTFGVSGLSANLPEMEQGFQKNLKEVLKSRRINHLEYILYFIFYKMKFLFRLGRNRYLKSIGK